MPNSQEERTAVPLERQSSYELVEPMLAATTDPRGLVRFMHDKARLSDREIATAMGTHAGTVRRWRSNKAKHMPRDIGPLDNMRVIVALLVNSGVVSVEEAGGFLRSRVVPPNDDIPLTLFAMGDEGFHRVREVAQSFVDGILVRRQLSERIPTSR